MILVNISAVGTSTTLTLHPVSFSHSGPEKLSGSSDCSPASQTIVIVLPAQIFLAASTAVFAALCAWATLAAASVTTAISTPACQRMPVKRFFMVSPLWVSVVDLLNGRFLVRRARQADSIVFWCPMSVKDVSAERCSTGHRLHRSDIANVDTGRPVPPVCGCH